MDPARLQAIPLFAGLGEGELAHLAEVAGELGVDAGTTIAHEGDFGYAMFAIEEGGADVLHEGAVLRTLGPGDVFGEIAVLASGRRTASVVATSPMRLITFFNRDVWRLEEELPALAAALRERIAGHLEPAAER
jgi:CRP-like cAMP-binding protein